MLAARQTISGPAILQLGRLHKAMQLLCASCFSARPPHRTSAPSTAVSALLSPIPPASRRCDSHQQSDHTSQARAVSLPPQLRIPARHQDMALPARNDRGAWPCQRRQCAERGYSPDLHQPGPRHLESDSLSILRARHIAPIIRTDRTDPQPRSPSKVAAPGPSAAVPPVRLLTWGVHRLERSKCEFIVAPRPTLLVVHRGFDDAEDC
jgi:hypothetical protein